MPEKRRLAKMYRSMYRSKYRNRAYLSVYWRKPLDLLYLGKSPTLSAINNLGYQPLLVIFRLFKGVTAAAQIGEGQI